MRLDLLLTGRGLAESREKAKRLIVTGAVLVDGAAVRKPAADVAENAVLTVNAADRYVGRGGLKLEAALDRFGVDPAGLSALDIGASTGGFTDCLLQRGAARVTALDAGCGQLHPTLRADARVTCIEKYNARELTAADVGLFDLVVMDVSFISAAVILPRIPDVLKPEGRLILLIKPQFEAGRAALNKNGVVTKAADRERAVRSVLAAAAAASLACDGIMVSPIAGGDGNTEYLASFLVRPGADNGGVPVADLFMKECEPCKKSR